MINTLFANSYGAFGTSFNMSMGFFTIGAILLFILVIAILALKGYSLWNAAKRGEKGWFIALLLLNTIGILEIIYLYFIVKIGRKQVENDNKDLNTDTSQK